MATTTTQNVTYAPSMGGLFGISGTDPNQPPFPADPAYAPPPGSGGVRSPYGPDGMTPPPVTGGGDPDPNPYAYNPSNGNMPYPGNPPAPVPAPTPAPTGIGPWTPGWGSGLSPAPTPSGAYDPVSGLTAPSQSANYVVSSASDVQQQQNIPFSQMSAAQQDQVRSQLATQTAQQQAQYQAQAQTKGANGQTVNMTGSDNPNADKAAWNAYYNGTGSAPIPIDSTTGQPISAYDYFQSHQGEDSTARNYPVSTSALATAQPWNASGAINGGGFAGYQANQNAQQTSGSGGGQGAVGSGAPDAQAMHPATGHINQPIGQNGNVEPPLGYDSQGNPYYSHPSGQTGGVRSPYGPHGQQPGFGPSEQSDGSTYYTPPQNNGNGVKLSTPLAPNGGMTYSTGQPSAQADQAPTAQGRAATTQNQSSGNPSDPNNLQGNNYAGSGMTFQQWSQQPWQSDAIKSGQFAADGSSIHYDPSKPVSATNRPSTLTAQGQAALKGLSAAQLNYDPTNSVNPMANGEAQWEKQFGINANMWRPNLRDKNGNLIPEPPQSSAQGIVSNNQGYLQYDPKTGKGVAQQNFGNGAGSQGSTQATNLPTNAQQLVAYNAGNPNWQSAGQQSSTQDLASRTFYSAAGTPFKVNAQGVRLNSDGSIFQGTNGQQQTVDANGNVYHGGVLDGSYDPATGKVSAGAPASNTSNTTRQPTSTRQMVSHVTTQNQNYPTNQQQGNAQNQQANRQIRPDTQQQSYGNIAANAPQGTTSITGGGGPNFNNGQGLFGMGIEGDPNLKPAAGTPDYMTIANQQSQANIGTQIGTSNLNNPNQYGPGGSQVRVLNPDGSYSLVQSLSQPLQQNYDAANALKGQLLNNAQNAAGSQLNYAGVAPQAQYDPSGASQVNSLDTSGVSAIPAVNAAAQKQAQDAAYAQQTQYLDPQFAQQQQALNSQLANQGIMPGSQAYQTAQDNFARQKQQAYSNAQSQAITLGNQEQQSLFGMGLQSNQQGQANALAQFNTGLQQHTAGINDALTQFNTGMQTRQQGVSEANQLHNSPINDINALNANTQIQLPTYQGFSTTAGANTDYLSAANMQNQANLGVSNAAAAQSQNQKNAYMSLIAAGMSSTAAQALIQQLFSGSGASTSSSLLGPDNLNQTLDDNGYPTDIPVV